MADKSLGILVTHVQFARIILHIEGKILLEDRSLKGIKIYLEDYVQGAFAPSHIEIDKKKRTFSLRYNVMAVNHRYPLESGDYYLVLEKGGRKYYAAVADELHYANLKGRLVFPYPEGTDLRWMQDRRKDNDYSLWMSKGKSTFNALSMLDLDNDRYYLQVTYKLPGSATFKDKVRKKVKRIANVTVVPRRKKKIQKMYQKALQRRHGRNSDKPTILFASASRAEIGGNEEFIYNRLVERGLDRQFHILFNFTDGVENCKSLSYARKMTRQLASSDIIIVDDFFPFIYQFTYPADVKVIQVWHACGAFKAVGLERMDKAGSPAFNSNSHKSYTHMPVSSPLSGLHNAEGFGIPESCFLPIGVPRTDIFFDEEYGKNMAEKLRGEFPLIAKRDKIYLYGPTFRGNGQLSAYFPMEYVDLEKWGAFCEKHNALLLIKMHPFVEERMVIPEKYKDYILDLSEYREVNDILFITDVLITDYSSIIYEFSLLRRPMYFYAFDQRMYEAKRDFYEPYADIVPGEIIKNFDDLMDALEKEEYDYTILDSFIKKNFTYTDGKSTDRFIDQLLLNQQEDAKEVSGKDYDTDTETFTETGSGN